MLEYIGISRPCVLSCSVVVWLFVTLWTVACQAPLSMGFSRKNTGVGCHFLLQRIFWLRDGTSVSGVSHIAGRFITIWAIREAQDPISSKSFTLIFVYIIIVLKPKALEHLARPMWSSNPPHPSSLNSSSASPALLCSGGVAHWLPLELAQHALPQGLCICCSPAAGHTCPLHPFT